jgi:hypothetical protein
MDRKKLRYLAEEDYDIGLDNYFAFDTLNTQLEL